MPIIHTSRAERRQLARDNAKLPARMLPVPGDEWPASLHPPTQLWRSRDYLAQVYAGEGDLAARISVCRTQVGKDGRWLQDIPWQDLQRIKSELGFEGFDAVEVYPRDEDVVNVANMRHLWVVRTPLPFAWRK